MECILQTRHHDSHWWCLFFLQPDGQLPERYRDMQTPAAFLLKLGLFPPVVKLIVNRAPGGKINEGIQNAIKEHGLDLLAVLPHDETIYELDSEGKPTADIPADAPFKKALYDALDTLEL